MRQRGSGTLVGIASDVTLLGTPDKAVAGGIQVRPGRIVGVAGNDITLADMALMSDAPGEWLASFGPSHLEPLAALCKKVNPHFFRVRAVVQAALIAHTRAILAGPSVATSSTPPVP